MLKITVIKYENRNTIVKLDEEKICYEYELLTANSKTLYQKLAGCVENDSDYIFIYGGLNGKTSSSFRDIFAKVIPDFEKEMNSDRPENAPIKKIKVFSLGNMGEDIKGYCFIYKGKKFISIPTIGKTNNDNIFSQAVEKANNVIKKNAVLFPDGIKLKENVPHRKKSLIKKILPQKTDSGKEYLRKIISICAVFTLLVTGGILSYNLVFKSVQNNIVQSEVQDIFYNEGNSSDSAAQVKAKNWKKLKKINSEIVGWVATDNSKIDYPVLFHKDDNEKNQYYLNHNYKKQGSGYGAIFIDYRCYNGVKSKNIVLHGHSMNDGSMFQNLIKYGTTSGNLNFYKKNSTISFSTPKEDSEYKIISVMKVNTISSLGETFPYMQGKFLSSAEFMNYVYQVRIRSLIDCPVDVNESDTLITLSTCSYEIDGFRTVVVARKLRKGETATVAVSNAKLNKNARFPECWYRKYGGSQPKGKTFSEALKDGDIDWYDGNNHLKGRETLTGGTEPTTAKVYTLTLLNDDGSTFLKKKVTQGTTVKDTGHPIKKADKNYTYQFIKWDKSLKNISSDITAKPIFKKEKIKKAETTATKTTKATQATKATTKPTKATTPHTKATTKATTPTTKPTHATTAPTEVTTEQQEE